MSAARAEVARIVRTHLEDILDTAMAAFCARIPKVAKATDLERRGVREATRRAIEAFLALYAEEEVFDGPLLDDARRVTIERAGEFFDRDEILAMMATAREVVYEEAQRVVRAEGGGDATGEVETTAALESFLAELRRADHQIEPYDAVQHLLMMAEAEGPDIA